MMTQVLWTLYLMVGIGVALFGGPYATRQVKAANPTTYQWAIDLLIAAVIALWPLSFLGWAVAQRVRRGS